MAQQPVAVGMLFEPLGEDVDRFVVTPQVGEASTEPDDRRLVVGIGQVRSVGLVQVDAALDEHFIGQCRSVERPAEQRDCLGLQRRLGIPLGRRAPRLKADNAQDGHDFRANFHVAQDIAAAHGCPPGFRPGVDNEARSEIHRQLRWFEGDSR